MTQQSYPQEMQPVDNTRKDRHVCRVGDILFWLRSLSAFNQKEIFYYLGGKKLNVALIGN